jgi:hypothetical protein
MKNIWTYLITLFFSSQAFSAPWTFEIVPYLWAINMNGRVSVGPKTIHIDEDFSELLKQFDTGGMIYTTAHKDNFGLYFNGIYASLSNSGEVDDITASGRNKFGILGGGISYIVFHRELSAERSMTLEPYLGLRYTFNNTTIDVLNLTFRKNVHWTDPVIGFQFTYGFNKVWAAQLSGDIGGTNTSTHYSYSTSALVHYQAKSWKHVKTYLGYRLLDQHYQTGENASFYDWDVKIFGPVIGVGFEF